MIRIYDMHVAEDRIPYLEKTDEMVDDELIYDTPGKVVQLVNDIFSADIQAEEHVYEMVFDSKHHLVAAFEVNHGSVGESMVNTAGILQRCLMTGTSFILLHNHPSGCIQASRDDIALTKRLYDASKLCGLNMQDHIIIGRGCYASMLEEGLLEK